MRPRWVALAAVMTSPRAMAETNGLAVSAPLMGWSSWSFLRHSPTNGIQVLANYVHGLGLKFGLYVTPGISDQAVSAKTPILGISYTANQIADGASENNYNCGGMQGIDYSKPGAQAWSTGLGQTGRPMALELSNSLNIADGTTWSSLANGWRTGGDIECYCGSGGSSYPLTDWNNVSGRFNAAASWQPYGGPGGWNDYDSIEVGNGSNDGLASPERQAQLSLWSLASAPMLLGVDLTSLDSGDLALLKNTAVIAADQDGIPADRVIDSGNEQVFDKRQQNGTWDIGIFNTDTSASHTFSVSLAQLGLAGSAKITDLWSGASDGTSTGTFTTTVQPGGVTLISAVAASGTGGTGELVSAQSGDCLDTAGNGTPGPYVYFPGTKVELWPCDGGANQKWTLTQ